MSLIMKRALILIILTILIQTTYAQKTAARRFISYADLTDPPNLPFTRREMDVTVLLFNGAKNGSIPLFYFDSFKKLPKPFSRKQLADKLQELDQLRFKPWQEGKMYSMGAGATSSGYRYRSLQNRNDRPPGDFAFWEYLPTPDYIIGVDYQELPSGSQKVQYIHFFTDDFKYVVSFKASDAAEFLNKTGYLWYRIEKHMMQHLSGDIYLFDYYHQKKIADLWPLLDTAKLKISKEWINENLPPQLGLQTAYRNGKIIQFLLTHEIGQADYTTSLLDTISISELRTNLDKNSAEFYLIGDALLKPQLYGFSETHRSTELKLLDFESEQQPPTRVDTISYMTSERFGLSGQSDNPRAFEKNVSALLYLVYEGIAENSLRVYSSDSLSRSYTPSELVNQWHAGAAPENWDAKTHYSAEDEVIYEGVVYVALEHDSAGGPSARKEKWMVKVENENIYQPEAIRQFEIVYQVLFTENGKVVSKIPFAIAMQCLNRDYMTKLGYLDFKELKDFIMRRNPGLWKKIAPWIEGQNGAYQIISNSPLKACRK